MLFPTLIWALCAGLKNTLLKRRSSSHTSCFQLVGVKKTASS